MEEVTKEEHSGIECPIVSPPSHGMVPVQRPIISETVQEYDSESSSLGTVSVQQYNNSKSANIFCGISKEKIKGALKIKRKFLLSKVSYFTVYSSRSIFATYFILFLTSAGLDPEQAGLIQGIRMMVLTLSGLFWGILADRSKKYGLILQIELIFFAMITFAKPWVAYWISRPETSDEHRAHIQDAVEDIIRNQLNSSLDIAEIMEKSDKTIISKYKLSWHPNHYKTASTPLFMSMLGLGIASAFFAGGVLTLLESRIVFITKTLSNNKNAYGRQRLWGSVAYSIMPVICGLILEAAPENSISKFMPAFYIHLSASAVAVITCYFLYQQRVEGNDTNIHNENDGETEKVGVFGALKKVVKNPRMVIFFLNAMFIGFGNGMEWSFVFLYLEEMKASKTLIGICVLAQCGTEAIMFPFIPKVIQRIGNNKIATTSGLLGYALAFLILCNLTIPAPSIFVTAILGVTFTIFYCGSIDELYKTGNPKCMTSLFAIFNAVLCGLGSAIAGILGGVIYKNFGGKTLFLCNGIVFTLLVIANICYIIIDNKLQRQMPTTTLPSIEQHYVKFCDAQDAVKIVTRSAINTNNDDDAALLIDNTNLNNQM